MEKLTDIYFCIFCTYGAEIYPPPVDDSCPQCGKAGLKRQVLTLTGYQNFNPKKHNEKGGK